ncbi:hypothetical protein [Streptomyces sp. NPDC060035]|uniref:hypothetical protein n=1 Tax=Streptomyces sp. NPDC060035 TaxID=3347044 RepID=UPI00368C35EC
MDPLVPFAALLGALIGAFVAWMAPRRTGKINRFENDRIEAKKHDKERIQELKEEEKSRRDALFDRLVVLRNETRLHVLELHRLYSIAESTKATPRSMFGAIHWYQQSTCHDIARSVGASYPQVQASWYEYAKVLSQTQTDLSNFEWTFLRRRKFLEFLKGLIGEMDAAREDLKGALTSAANDLGYKFVLAEEWNEAP